LKDNPKGGKQGSNQKKGLAKGNFGSDSSGMGKLLSTENKLNFQTKNKNSKQYNEDDENDSSQDLDNNFFNPLKNDKNIKK
jgi:hypothetical protein